MKFSVAWLEKWVAVDSSVNELAAALTNAGLEVDGITRVAPDFSAVTVAEIAACEKHPDADKLSVCQVYTGSETVQVVCGAPNARVGLKAPFASVGAVLPGGFQIKAANIRGVESNGMLCSAKELGLSEDAAGLMELPEDIESGSDLRAALDLDDYTIELDLTPNRADCLSIRGIARDVSAILSSDMRNRDIPVVIAATETTRNVRLEDPQGCPRYAGRVIEGINPAAKTPFWIAEVLRRSGLRCIDPVVDITNFVMLELGQPMHAFDADTLSGDIIVRRGRAGEKLRLLDESEASLDENYLLITDADRVLAVAGVMGGAGTGVSPNTRNIFLESAFFNPAVIMGKARLLGLHTDASHRFERGVNPQRQEEAIERATELLLACCGGAAGPLTVTESLDHIPANQHVELRLARLNRVLGSNLLADDVAPILERLEMNARFENGTWTVLAPPSRFDIAIEEDLIEEVARIYGYNRLPTDMPEGELPTPVLPERQVPPLQIREALCAAGYQEVINYSFIDHNLLNRFGITESAVALANPLSADMDVMRTALIPGLLQSLAHNARRQKDRLRLFEIGNVFAATEEAPDEYHRVAGVVSGTAMPEQWAVKPAATVDFYDLKGDVESLLALRGAEKAVFSTAELTWLHPGQAAEVSIKDESIGWLGAIHPTILKAWGLPGPVFAFELDLNLLASRGLPRVSAVSKFPAIRRDLAIVVPEKIKFVEIEACIREIAGDLLTNLLLFDVYSGQNIEKTYKSLAIGLILQDVSSTLVDEEVNSLVSRVVTALETQLNAKLRG